MVFIYFLLLALCAHKSSAIDPTYAPTTAATEATLFSFTCGTIGISCRNSIIDSINLTSSNIKSTIPSIMWSFTNLTYLDLANNSIVGTLSTEIGYLTKLNYFRIASNQLTGTIPSEIGKLSNASQIILFSNQLKGSIPDDIKYLSNCTRLSLHHNNLTGIIPSSIQYLSNLEELYLNSNLLTGTIPTALSNLQNLSILILNNNYLSNSIPSQIGLLSKLTNINLSNNRLSNTIPSEIGQITNLNSLILNHNLLNGQIPLNVLSCFSLQNFSIIQNSITGTLPSQIQNLNRLIGLFLSFNDMTGSIPSSIGSLNLLQQFDISYNAITGTIPTEIGKCSSLQSIGIYWSSLSGTIPTEFGRLTNMKSIMMHKNSITGAIPTEIGLLSNLKLLSLATNPIRGTIPLEIFNLQRLTELFLVSTSLSGTIPTQIGQLQNMLRFFITDCNIYSTIPTEIGKLTKLLALNIYNTKLSGSIPTEVGNLLQITALNLFKNQLVGTLPKQLGYLVNLRRFSVAQNLLYGSLPTELGHCRKLNELLLSSNSFSSTIPTELGNLIQIQNISVFRTNMCGKLPDEVKKVCNVPSGCFDFYAGNSIPCADDISTVPPTFSNENLTSALASSISIQNVSNVISLLDDYITKPLQDVGDACTASLECTSNKCYKGKCESDTKLCISISPEKTCSGNGRCDYWDVTGAPINSCAANNASCIARCSCFNGYSGKSCDLSTSKYIENDLLRKTACTKLTELLENSPNVTATYAVDTIDALLSIYSSTEGLTTATIDECASTLNEIITTDSQANLNTFTRNISAAVSFLQIISLGIENIVNAKLNAEVYDTDDYLIDKMNGLLETATFLSLSNTQHNFTLATPSFILNSYYLSVYDLSNKQYASPGFSIQLPPTGLNTCEDNSNSNGEFQFSVMKWLLNPYNQSTNLRSDLFRWTLKDLQVDKHSLPTRNTNDTFLLHMSYITQQSLSIIPDEFGNITVPGCKYRQDEKYQTCDCSLSSYNNESVSFLCNIATNLCPLKKSTHKLESNHNNTNSSDRNIHTRDFGVMLDSGARVFTLVLTSNPLIYENDRGFIAIGVLSGMIIFLIFGLIYFARWDYRDRFRIILTPSDTPYKPFQVLKDFEKRLDDSFLSGNVDSNIDDPFLEQKSDDLRQRELHISRIGWILRHICSCCNVSLNSTQRFSLLVGGDVIPRIIHGIRNYNPIIWCFSFKSLQITRVVRFANSWKTILVFMMVAAIFFDIYNYNDGTCADNSINEQSCLSIPSDIGGVSECIWNDGSCDLRPPPSSPEFFITVAVFTTLITQPIDFIIYLVLICFCSKNPDFDNFFTTSFDIAGETSAESAQSEEDAVNKIFNAINIFSLSYDSSNDNNGDLERVQIVLQKFGLYYDGKMREVKLTTFARLRFGNIKRCLRNHVHETCKSAQILIENAQHLEDPTSREAYLLQHFILDQFRFGFRNILRRIFAHVITDRKEKINPFVWLLGWIFILFCLSCMLSWISLWAVSRGSVCIHNWAYNVLMNIFLDVFLVSIISVVFADIIVTGLFRRKLIKLRNDMLKVHDIVSHTNRLESHCLEYVAYFTSPASLAANDPSLDETDGARSLRLFYLSDTDWSNSDHSFAIGTDSTST